MIFILCFNCGHFNQENIKNCTLCQSALFLPENLPEIFIPLLKWQKNCQEIVLGEITLTEFNQKILLEEKSINEINKKIKNLHDSPHGQEFKIELEKGKEGLELYAQALEFFKEYLKDRKLISLKEGLLKMEEALRKINQAAQLNWEAFLNLKKSAEEFLKEYREKNS